MPVRVQVAAVAAVAAGPHMTAGQHRGCCNNKQGYLQHYLGSPHPEGLKFVVAMILRGARRKILPIAPSR